MSIRPLSAFTLVRGLAIVGLAVCAFVGCMAGDAAVRPAQVETIERHPTHPEVARQMLQHPTHPDRRVELLWQTPEGDGPWPAVLFVHGHQWPKRPGAATYLERPNFADTLAAGWAVAAVSQPGYGGSHGPSDFCGPDSQQAVRAALAALRANPRIDRQRIVLYGASRGAIVSSMVATTDHELVGLVLRGGIYDIEDAYHRMDDNFSGKQNLELEAGTSAAAFRARSALLADDEIRTPTLFFHGTADPISPIDQVEALAARLRQVGTPAEVVAFADAGHRLPWPPRRRKLLEFLDQVTTDQGVQVARRSNRSVQ